VPALDVIEKLLKLEVANGITGRLERVDDMSGNSTSSCHKSPLPKLAKHT
jgi:hypothetical protein